MAQVDVLLGNGTRVEIDAAGETRITLVSGAIIEGCPQGEPSAFDAGQIETAHRLGYGDDVAAMTRDHDPLHAWLTDRLGLEASYSMLAADGSLAGELAHLAALEEDAVLAVQRFVRAAGVDVARLVA